MSHKDVDVLEDESRPTQWVAIEEDNTVHRFENEAEACAFQRGYRAAQGLDPLTGE